MAVPRSDWGTGVQREVLGDRWAAVFQEYWGRGGASSGGRSKSGHGHFGESPQTGSARTRCLGSKVFRKRLGWSGFGSVSGGGGGGRPSGRLTSRFYPRAGLWDADRGGRGGGGYSPGKRPSVEMIVT